MVEFRLINVGISDLNTGGENDILRTILGSCVGVCLYDKYNLIGGLSHILLPENRGKEFMPKKYADTAIPMLIKAMAEYGANPKTLTAKLVGGARMFPFASALTISEIGDNNIKKAREILNNLNINIIAEDVGGDFGRTMDFFINDGIVRVRSSARPEKII